MTAPRTRERSAELLPIALVVWLTLCHPSAAAEPPPLADSIRLTLANPLPVARSSEPVTCGVPLPRSFAQRAEDLALRGPEGQAVSVQLHTTGTYEDGTPRWVLLNFLADVPASSRTAWSLAPASRPANAQRLVYRMDSGVASVDTGAAVFRIDTNRFRLFDSVIVGGQELVASGVTAVEPAKLRESDGGAVLISEDGRRHGSQTMTPGKDASAEPSPAGGPLQAGQEQAVWEDAGPLSCVLCVRGRIGPAAKVPLARFVCRMQFFAGLAEVRVSYTLHNPAAHEHPGNVWDLGSGGSIGIEDFSLELPLAEASWSPRVGAEADLSPWAASKLYQDSSGGANWNSANHVDRDFQMPQTFRGYLVDLDGAELARGLRADGWLHTRSPLGGVAVAVRDFWQNFPKALELRGNSLRVGLWPGESAGVHELLGGEQKTHELLFVFHGKEANDQEVERRMVAFHSPLVALPDPGLLSRTRAFWPTGPLDRDRFAALESTCDRFVEPDEGGASVIAQWEQIDEFGWRHYGDTFADNERSPDAMFRDFPEHHVGRRPISHFGNEYDVAYTVLLQGLRREDPRWFTLADALCRHIADIGIYHTDEDGAAAYRHGPFTHTTHDTAAFRSTHRMYPREAGRYGSDYASGGPNAGHCYVASLAQHYYLTGNRTSREAFLEVAGWSVDSPWFRDMMVGDRRAVGNLLMTHVEAYQLTGERRYYDAAVQMIESVRQPFAGLGANLFAKALGRFLDLKLDSGQRDADYELALVKLLELGDLHLGLRDGGSDGSLEMACFHSELFCTCSLHAAANDPRREQYFARGAELMDSIRDRWPGTYCPTKTLTMCFANTGAYLRALELRKQ